MLYRTSPLPVRLPPMDGLATVSPFAGTRLSTAVRVILLSVRPLASSFRTIRVNNTSRTHPIFPFCALHSDYIRPSPTFPAVPPPSTTLIKARETTLFKAKAPTGNSHTANNTVETCVGIALSLIKKHIQNPPDRTTSVRQA